MMIDKRLIGMMGDSKRYIARNVALQWLALAASIAMIFAVSRYLGALYDQLTIGDCMAGAPNLPLTLAVMAAALLVQAVGAVVNVWWKISMHCAGAGGLAGALVAYSALFGFDPTGWLCVLILLCGAVGSARMLLRQHSLGQVVAGTLVGAACGLAGILWL